MVDKKNLKKDPHKKLVEVAKGDTWLNYPTIQCSIDKNETQKIPIIVQLKNWYFQNKMRNNVLVIEHLIKQNININITENIEFNIA